MKKVEYVIETKKNPIKRKIIITVLIIVLLVSILLLTKFVMQKVNGNSENIAKDGNIQNSISNEVVEEKRDISIERNINVLDIKNILNENTKNVETKSLVVDEMDLDYKTIYRENPNLAQGMIKTVQEGLDGAQQVIVVKTYSGNEYIGEERVTSRVTKGTVDKIVEIGTGKDTYSYTAQVGDTVYVTPETLTLRKLNNTKSEKVCTLKKNTAVQIVEIKGEWLRVKADKYVGYAQSNCFEGREKDNTPFNIEPGKEYTKEELLKSLDKNMDLNKPSGFTLDQFKKVLSGNPADTKHVIEDNAKYFYYAEKQYNINGIYLASMAIHEGGWGKSRIAQDKKNLFGYGAYDRNPYGGSYSFDTYAEGIDLVARVLVKHYINKKGTKIFDGQTATGKYYNGPN